MCNDLGGSMVQETYTLLDGSEMPYEKWQDCECAKLRLQRSIFKSSQMSRWMMECRFDNFTHHNRPQSVIGAHEAAKHYFSTYRANCDKAQNSIALLGKPGSGKTHLLSAVANNLMRQEVRVMYFPHVEGMEELKEDFDKMPEKVHAMKRVDVLYWDDLFKGRDKPTAWQLEKIFEVVNYRYLNNLPMLISSERTIDDLVDIDEGIGSRIYSMCKNHCVELEATDEEVATGKKLNYRLV